MNLLVSGFEQYTLLPIVLLLIALIVLALKYGIPILLAISGVLSIYVAVELAVGEASIIIVAVFGVLAIYLFAETIGRVR